MKYIITIFIASALSMLSFNIAEQMDFYSFFKMAYSESFNGLDKMKNDKGQWSYTNSVSEFDLCKLQHSTERNVKEMTLIRVNENEIASKEMMHTLETQLDQMLPTWQYKKTLIKNQDGTQMATYTYLSESAAERNKYPIVELDVVKENDKFELSVRLYEPKELRK